MKRFLESQSNSKTGARLPVDLVARLQEVVDDAQIEQELVVATEWCTKFLEGFVTPGGISATPLTHKQVSDRLAHTVGTKGQVIFGGTLSMLSLDARVRPTSDLDLGRMRWACEHLLCAHDLPAMLGTIVVSGDQLPDELKGLVRVERDSEIDVAILAMYWHRDHEDARQALGVQTQNIVYSAEHVGVGVTLSVERFVRVEKEEAKRKVPPPCDQNNFILNG